MSRSHWLAAAFAMTLALIAPAHGQRELPDFADLAEKQGAAVVNISTTQVQKGRPGFQLPPGIDEDDPMFEFFKRFIPRQPPGGTPHDFESKSLGSGFVISADGYILTNAHVVDAADEILVRLTDKREYKAKVIGADKRTDIALIKIDASNLPKVTLGDPAKLRVGEWVIAIGSPFGFDNTVTAGIVSAKGRSLPQENFVPFIQTDVAVNPGNSGGPLFNMKGEVVGINSQIYSRTGGFMGLSFAIPIDIAMEIQNQLRISGKVSRGRIGVVIQEVTKELSDSFGLAKPQGALVSSVEKAGPAEKAGVEPGDIILKFDGKPVAQSSDLPRMVGGTKPGTRSTVQVFRKGQTRDLTVAVAEIPEEKAAQRKSKPAKGEPAANQLGLVLSELTAEQKRDLKVQSGVLVEDVRNGMRIDLRAGDVILSAIYKGATTEIKSADQFNKLVANVEKGQNLTLLVRRGENQLFVTIKAPNER
ncbi:MAG: DegQ family serine endoprotease [Sterolibacteriaceae bacterium]|nr:DegQ family serine endoprotease [Candidatus Methylophosphatis haderslevensis]